MLAEAGLALVEQRASLPGVALGGGFLTPSTAFGSALMERLQSRDILKFDIIRDDLATPPTGDGAAAPVPPAGAKL